MRLIEWKSIDGFPYSVSNTGLVKNNTTSRILKPWLNKQGYYAVGLFKNGVGKHITIHRLVASAFISNTESKTQVNHIDGNRENNYVENLEWVTNQENQQHRFWKLGNTSSPEQIEAMNKARMVKVKCKETGKEYPSIKEAAEICGINSKSISDCIRGKLKTAGGVRWERLSQGGKDDGVD